MIMKLIILIMMKIFKVLELNAIKLKKKDILELT